MAISVRILFFIIETKFGLSGIPLKDMYSMVLHVFILKKYKVVRDPCKPFEDF